MHSILLADGFVAVKVLSRESNYMNDWICFHSPSLFLFALPSDGHAIMWSHFSQNPAECCWTMAERNCLWLLSNEHEKGEKAFLALFPSPVGLFMNLDIWSSSFIIQRLKWDDEKKFVDWKIFFSLFQFQWIFIFCGNAGLGKTLLDYHENVKRSQKKLFISTKRSRTKFLENFFPIDL